jgi:energy-coupling factor transport system ATP-binding protein
MNRFDPEWIDALVRLFRLEPLVNRPPYRLSCGEKKRVAFAAALSARPEVLVLDEPTSGQDRHFKTALGGFLTELRDRGQTVVIVTHDLSFAGEYASRWLMMKAGRIVSEGRPRRVDARAPGEGERA